MAQGRSLASPQGDKRTAKERHGITRRRRRGCRKATRFGGRKPSHGCGVGARVTRRTLAGPWPAGLMVLDCGRRMARRSSLCTWNRFKAHGKRSSEGRTAREDQRRQGPPPCLSALSHFSRSVRHGRRWRSQEPKAGRTWGTPSGNLSLEGRISDEVVRELKRRGQPVQMATDWNDCEHGRGLRFGELSREAPVSGQVSRTGLWGFRPITGCLR